VNTELSSHVDEQKHNHPPSNVRPASERRVGLADRIALHLGIALITWSRRPWTVAPQSVASQSSFDQLRARREAAIALAAREREWQLAWYLSQPRR
jgi:hypothetical protein